MSRVMLCHCGEAGEDAVRAGDLELVSCEDSASMVDELAIRRPDLVVYGLRAASASDLAVLRLLRTLVPDVPLVVLGDDPSPEWTVPADLDPLYLAARPAAERARPALRIDPPAEADVRSE